MRRDVVDVNVNVLKKLIDERYGGSSRKMGEELCLGQIVKNALCNGQICEAYARLIKFETGVDIVKHVDKSFEDMSDNEKFEILRSRLDHLVVEVTEIKEQMQSETQLCI